MAYEGEPLLVPDAADNLGVIGARRGKREGDTPSGRGGRPSLSPLVQAAMVFSIVVLSVGNTLTFKAMLNGYRAKDNSHDYEFFVNQLNVLLYLVITGTICGTCRASRFAPSRPAAPPPRRPAALPPLIRRLLTRPPLTRFTPTAAPLSPRQPSSTCGTGRRG